MTGKEYVSSDVESTEKKKNNKNTSLIFKLIVYPIDVLIFVFILFYAVTFFGFQHRVILSGSMEPYLKVNDLVVVKECNIGDAQVGDVIAFTVGDSVVCHRVYSMNGDGTVTTKGDAVQDVDLEMTTKDNFIGKVVFKVPNGHFIAVVTQSVFFKIFVVIMAIITFFI